MMDRISLRRGSGSAVDRIENVQHPGLHNGGWEKIPFHQQMGNIGSEVSRMLKWKEKGNHTRSEKALLRPVCNAVQEVRDYV